MGGTDSWAGGNIPARPLMGWDRVEALAGEGVRFGAHSINHPNLAALDPETLEEEISGSGQDIAARLDQPIRHFAPPYGATSTSVRRQIALHYDTSVGTRLGVAGPKDDIHDLPRLEMFYFTDIARWRAHLDGRGGPYLAARKLMRGVRAAIRGNPW